MSHFFAYQQQMCAGTQNWLYYITITEGTDQFQVDQSVWNETESYFDETALLKGQARDSIFTLVKWFIEI